MKFFFPLLLLLLATTVTASSNSALDTNSYAIIPAELNIKAQAGTFKLVPLIFINKQDAPLSLTIAAESSLANVVRIDESALTIPAKGNASITLTFLSEALGTYTGSIVLGGINERIPASLEVMEDDPAADLLTTSLTLLEKEITAGKTLKIILDMQGLLIGKQLNVSLGYVVIGGNSSKMLLQENHTLNVSLSLIREIDTTAMAPGDYVLEVHSRYLDKQSTSAVRFTLTIPLLEKKLFGILPLKYLLLLLLASVLGVSGFKYYRKRQEKKKRYKSRIHWSEMPQAGPRSVVLGRIAETAKQTYFDIDQLMMHTLVAGSTGGGKTVSAEVIVEEALMKGAAVIVFDPTAQWTGFLRKNVDKKMFSLYPQYGLKPSDARAFNGNVRQILNPRELVEIKKYMKPGEITIFAINRLDPQDIDIVVANTVRQVFRANLPESKQLKLMVIFDEVHRLLPKFGGSGQGFIQVERAAREFRKWGVGLMLISQVLTDFAGETKANISTEIQMRTRDQGDLDRIKTKYGDYMLQSLLKSATGTGMMENASYNRGDPFFVSFRPLLHEHAALSDDVLANYNKYNDILDNAEFQIDELKSASVDTFDIQLEYKMALDKVKSGNFNMVDIYLESLLPRIESEFKKLGRKAPKRKAQLVSDEELKKQHAEAVKLREKEAANEGKKEAKEEKPDYQPLRLKSGLVVVNPLELEDTLGIMKNDDFAYHVNDKKNDFADWIQPINPDLATKVRAAKSRQDTIAALKTGAKAAEAKAAAEKQAEDKQ